MLRVGASFIEVSIMIEALILIIGLIIIYKRKNGKGDPSRFFLFRILVKPFFKYFFVL